MTSSEVDSIKESIQRIEKFSTGYPRLITTNSPAWDKFFACEYRWCDAKAELLQNNARGSTQEGATIQLPMLYSSTVEEEE